MKTKTFVIGSILVVLIVVISSFSVFYIANDMKTEKTASVPLPSALQNYSVPVSNNSSGVMFTITFKLNGFPGGAVNLCPNVVLYSQTIPNNFATNSSLSNLSAYFIAFWSSSLFVRYNQSASSNEQYGWLVQNNTSQSASGPIIQWNNNGIWGIGAGRVVLPSGNFQVTDKVFFKSVQPAQAQLNVTYAKAWVELQSLVLNAVIRSGTGFTISDISLS